MDGCSRLSSAVLCPPKLWTFPVLFVLLTVFKPHCRSFVEDLYKSILFSCQTVITSRNDRFIQAERLKTLGTDCLLGLGGCVKAHTWGDVVCDPVVTNKCRWEQHSDQLGHHQTHLSWPWQPALWLTGHKGWKHYLSMYMCKWKTSYALPAHVQRLMMRSIFCGPQRALQLPQLTL